MKVMKEEEDSFLRTLENGIKLLNGVMEDTRKAGKTEIAGEEAFTLFDTFGFPLDLTQLICRENGMTVDEAGFNVEMQKQKDRARNAAQKETGDWVKVGAGAFRDCASLASATIPAPSYRETLATSSRYFSAPSAKVPSFHVLALAHRYGTTSL